MMRKIVLLHVFLFLGFISLNAQTEIVEPISYGNLDKWMVREIKESAIIGGSKKHIYEIVEGDTLFNDPYKNTKSPWGVSSVLAKVSGITKASVTVFPEKRGTGFCARLETRIETVKVLGIININVLAGGTIFLGEMVEPITNTKNPLGKLNAGIPFTKRPKALQYDYKVKAGGKCVQSTGFSSKKDLDRIDNAEAFLYLQHRWEDAEGNIFAKRVGTSYEKFDKNTTTWTDKHRATIHYGDISKESFYKSYMALKAGDLQQYARNSKGKMMPIQETGWATNNEAPTHIILQFSSSDGGAYVGNTDSRFWIDNIGLVYDK